MTLTAHSCRLLPRSTSAAVGGEANSVFAFRGFRPAGFQLASTILVNPTKADDTNRAWNAFVHQYPRPRPQYPPPPNSSRTTTIIRSNSMGASVDMICGDTVGAPFFWPNACSTSAEPNFRCPQIKFNARKAELFRSFQTQIEGERIPDTSSVPLASKSPQTEKNHMSKKAAEHHKKASEHLTLAARHHGEGAPTCAYFEHRAPSWRGSPRICAACANWSQGTVQNCSHCSSYFGLIVRIFFPTASVDVSRIRRSDAMKWSTLYRYRFTHCAPMLPP